MKKEQAKDLLPMTGVGVLVVLWSTGLVASMLIFASLLVGDVTRAVFSKLDFTRGRLSSGAFLGFLAAFGFSASSVYASTSDLT